jgi:hypothetical protein
MSLFISDEVRVLGATANRALVTNASQNITASTTTSSELGFVSGVTSSIQTQLDSKVAAVPGILSASQVDATYLEMNGQIVSQAAHPNLFAAIGHQPEFDFDEFNLNPGLFANANFTGVKTYGNENIDSDNASTIIMCGAQGLVARSTNNGTTWALESFQNTVSGVVTLSVVRWVPSWGASGFWIIGGSGSNIQGRSEDGGRTWIAASAGSYNRYSFAHNASTNIGIFVGTNASIFRSTQGTSWSQVSNPLQEPVIGFTTLPILFSITYGFVGGSVHTWVAGADRRTIIYSQDDGVTWNVATVPPSSTNTRTIFAVRYIGGTIGRFVAVGTDELFHSADGVSWTSVTNSSFDTQYDISTNTTETCVIISSSTGYNTSTNGTTWTRNALPGSIVGSQLAVTFNPTTNTFALASSAGCFLVPFTGGAFQAATRVPLSRTVTCRCVLTAPGTNRVYLGTDNGGIIELNIATTADVIRAEPGYNIQMVAYGSGLYVALSRDARASVFTSPDKTTWTYRKLSDVSGTGSTTTFFNLSGFYIEFVNNRFIALTSGIVVFESTNGTTWLTRNHGGTNYNKYKVVWTGTNYLIGCNNAVIIRSPDLVTFTVQGVFTAPASGSNITIWDLIHTGSGVVVAVASNGWIFRSTDHGVNWTNLYIADIGSYSFTNIAYRPTNTPLLVTCTREGTIIARSVDNGSSWTTVQSPTTNAGSVFNGVVYGNGVFVVYGNNNVIGWSSDAQAWQWVALPGGYDVLNMDFGNGVFMGAGLFNSTSARTPPVVIWSIDGINWTARVVPHSLTNGALVPAQLISYVNSNWIVPSLVNTRSSIIWAAEEPYNRSTQFQIPTRYLGSGTSKLWIKGT